MPELEPEPDYVVKTRSPMLDDWRLNAVRGIKENMLLKEAGPIANRKCWRSGEAFSDCTLEAGLGREYKCKDLFQAYKA